MHKGKHRFKNRDKVRFAEKLEAVHELPNDSSFYRNLPFGLHLPEVQKYTPIVCRDPYAKPSKKKNKNEFGDMFLRDTTRLPFISLRSAENCVEKVAPKGKEMTSTYETRLPNPGNRPATIASDKRAGGNIIHFKYSDFMLTKIDRKSPSKGKLFVVKYWSKYISVDNERVKISTTTVMCGRMRRDKKKANLLIHIRIAFSCLKLFC